jgi:DNA-binding MarR family transcriptional regulator
VNISAPNHLSLVDEIVEQLGPIVARQRRAIARQGCLRAISSTHLHVLYLLSGEGDLPMGRLAEQLDASLPSVTGIIERMVERGFVERIRTDDDRRIVAVRVTDLGRQTLEEIDMLRRSQMAALLEHLTAEEQHRALQTFTDLRRAAEALDANEAV